MGKYMFRATYTQAGLAGLRKEGGARRREALTGTVEGMGGSVEAFYYAFGNPDLYIIAELADDATAAAVSMAIGAAGALNISVTVLVTPETIDEAAAKTVSYRAPGAD
jgi:uncharacterized protein with GYD domain